MARIELWNGDICDLEVDAIVNAANLSLWMSTGVGGFPLDEAALVAVKAVRDELPRSPGVEHVILAMRGAVAYQAFEAALAATADIADLAAQPAPLAAETAPPTAVNGGVG